MGCAACAFENPAGVRFCGECGARLVRICSSCRAENPPGFKFCGGCGASLAQGRAPALREVSSAPSPRDYTPAHLAERILAARADLTGERKTVTVLFADVTGSTALIQGLDPEEADALLKPVVGAMVDAVHRYEGTVNRIQGDGIMALFGAPLAHEDHAVRACYAALALQSAVAQLADRVRRERGVLLQARVGLNSGEVVIREIGSDLHVEYDAVGATTHLAARMEQLCPAGGVQLTPATLALAEGYVRVRSLGRVPVKGLTDPLEVYELLGAGQSRTRLQVAAARGLTRFVGRQAELETLWRAQEQAAAGHGQVVAVVGEPGVGKSRLFWEFAHSHRTADWLVLEASSVSYGQAGAYLPVVDLLKGYAGIEARDDTQRVREKVTGKVLTLDDGLRPRLTALLALLDVPIEDPAWAGLDPAQRRRRTLDALRRLFLRESQRQPLALVFEDLHWIDAETQALLDALVESVPTARLLLLVNYRPEYRHGWGGKTFYAQLRIDPLPPESAGELLAALVGDAADLAPLRRLLLERTGGNPFFLEESARALVETGDLTGERGNYHLATPVGRVRVPATVQAILAARIDRLAPADKRLLQAAAVVGKDVPYPLLAAVADLDDDALQTGLARLQAAEFLYEASLFPDPEYTFKHALTHEVAYGGVLQERRRTLHGRLVDAIETAAEHRLEEQVERLAHHALRGERWDAAIGYGRRAAARALGRSAMREALGYLEPALAALDHLTDDRAARELGVDLRLEVRASLFGLGEYDRVRETLEQALGIAEALDDSPRIAQVSLFLCGTYSVHDAARALEAGQRALALFGALGDVYGTAQTSHRLGQVHVVRSDFPTAIGCYRRTIELLGDELEDARPSDEILMPAVAARTFSVLALAEIGEFDEALTISARAPLIAERAAHAVSLLVALNTIGRVHVVRGDAPAAVPWLERARELGRDLDAAQYSPTSLLQLGYAYTFDGRIEEGLELLQSGVQRQTEQMGRRVGPYFIGALWLGEAYLRAGRPGDAATLADDWLTRYRAADRRWLAAHALRLRGEVASERGENKIARDRYSEALAEADALGMRPLAARCHLGLGELLRVTGQPGPAQIALSTAAEMLRAMAMPYWLARAEAELAALESSG